MVFQIIALSERCYIRLTLLIRLNGDGGRTFEGCCSFFNDKLCSEELKKLIRVLVERLAGPKRVYRGLCGRCWLFEATEVKGWDH